MPYTELKWVSKKEWGAVGNTHYASIKVGSDNLTYTIDQPRKGYWVARGWKNGGIAFNLYREGKTLAEMKSIVLEDVAQARTVAAKVSLTPATDEGQVTLTSNPVGHAPGKARSLVTAHLRPPTAMTTRVVRRFMTSLRAPFPCGCPSPSHRMSCGVDSAPRVVTS